MRKIFCYFMATAFAVALAAAFTAAPAEAKGPANTAAKAATKSCFKKAAEGNAISETLAKFQVDAALLQATDWAIYATWVTGAGTPGYAFGPRTYKCTQSGLWQCRGSATLCKL